jgi:drug/metabolite transporter (DMT)-like permease
MQQVQQAFGGAIVMLLAQSGIADAPIGIPLGLTAALGRGCGCQVVRSLSQRGRRGNAVPSLVLIPEIGDKR